MILQNGNDIISFDLLLETNKILKNAAIDLVTNFKQTAFPNSFNYVTPCI